MKPRVAVYKFASCDGCQLQLLNAEEALLDLAGEIDLAFFPEARSTMEPGPYDVVLVEGSITTAEDAERLAEIRRQAGFLMTIGACATAGGIQALRNWADVEDYKRAVYPSPQWIEALPTSTPIAAHVAVDYELHGCPVDRNQLLACLRSVLSGTRPRLPSHGVCLECKRRGAACVVVTRGEPCLGPVTRSGCGAVCPRMGRGCYGCFGPAEQAQVPTWSRLTQAHGLSPQETAQRLRGFTGQALAFREESDALARS